MSKVHTVKQGECLSAIAKAYGFADWRALYDHPDNAGLRQRRPSPNLLYPGDQIHIPPVKEKAESFQTGNTHRIIVKRPSRKLRAYLHAHDGSALADTDYVLFVKGTPRSGKTDSEGLLAEDIGDATECRLVIAGQTLELAAGGLNPLEQTDDGGISGAQMRLRGLGFNPGTVDGKLGPRTAAALRAFQRAQGLMATGELDAATRQKLTAAFGC